MDLDEAKRVLSKYQPMPPDSRVSEFELEELDQVCRLVESGVVDPELAWLMTGVFGHGSGFGVYSRVVAALCAVGPTILPTHKLVERMERADGSVRYWCAQVVVMRPDERFMPLLMKMLESDERDDRWAAIVALESIEVPQAVEALRSHRAREIDAELVELIGEIVGS